MPASSPAAPAGPAPHASAALPAALLGMAAAALYVAVRQDTSHEYDLYWLLPRLARGELDYPRHPLALHAADAWARALACLGGDLHERLRVASGLATGIAVAILTHAAFLLLRRRGLALLVGATFACLPANVHFATVMELHALYLPVAAAALWGACWIRSSPAHATVPAGLALGACTSLASGLHATAHLLVGFLGLWLLLDLRQQRLGLRPLAACLAAFAAAHAAGNLLLRWLLLPATSASPVAAQLGFVGESLHGWNDLHRTLAGEWLLPFLPVSVVCWLALRRPPRGLVLALAAACVAYLAVCQILLVLPGGGYAFHEFGAYQQPLAFAATVLAVQVSPPWWRAAMLAIALGASAVHLRHPAKDPADPAFGQVALAHLRAHDDRLLVGCFAEYDGVFALAWRDPQLAAVLPRLLGVRQFALEVHQAPARTATELALFFHPQVAGVHTVVTRGARDQLRAAGGQFAELVDVAWPALFTLRELRERGGAGGELVGWRLEPR